jgi:hypothetical protein
MTSSQVVTTYLKNFVGIIGSIQWSLFVESKSIQIFCVKSVDFISIEFLLLCKINPYCTFINLSNNNEYFFGVLSVSACDINRTDKNLLNLKWGHP